MSSEGDRRGRKEGGSTAPPIQIKLNLAVDVLNFSVVVVRERELQT